MVAKKGLGRGLESLFSMYNDDESDKNITSNNENSKKEGVSEIELDLVYSNPNQPRKYFDQEALDDLACSIKNHGVIQPIVLNKDDEGKFMIVAGERRYRASIMAGLSTIPAVVRGYSSRQIKEIAIIENLQREDLNPIETARAIKRLIEEYNLTQDIVAERIGKSRPAVTNTLRLLNLCPEVIKMVESGDLTAGLARALIVITDETQQTMMANKAIKLKMNVREVENAVKRVLNPRKEVEKIQTQSIELRKLVEELQRMLATKVTAIGNDEKGRIYIDYYNTDDLERIAEIIEKVQQS